MVAPREYLGVPRVPGRSRGSAAMRCPGRLRCAQISRLRYAARPAGRHRRRSVWPTGVNPTLLATRESRPPLDSNQAPIDYRLRGYDDHTERLIVEKISI